MQAKLSLFLIAAATVVAAIPQTNVGKWNGATNECDVGTLNCCQTVGKSTDGQIANQLGVIGVAVGAVDGLVGLQCNPITAIGAGGQNCNAQPVCCTGNNFQALVALGCDPVNVNV